MSEYARIREDVTRDVWGDKSRSDPTNPLHVKGGAGMELPETVRYQGGRGNIGLTPALEKKIIAINTPAGAHYIAHTAGGWVNRKGSGGQYPNVQQLSTACNAVEIITRGARNYARYQDVHGRVTPETYATDPCVIQCFTAVRPTGKTVLAAAAGVTQQIYFMIVADKPIWFAEEDLEFFPTLPIDVLTIVPGLNVRSAPAGNDIVGLLTPASPPVTVQEYRPRASNVWGRIGAGQWIALCHSTITNLYSTTWRMTTPPPPTL